jgi:hydroxypyruvate isomerase
MPLDERVRRISAAGFGVLLWGWRGLDLTSLSSISGAWFSGIDCVAQLKSTPVPASMVDPSGVEAYMRGIRESIDAAASLGCADLLLVTGEFDSQGKVSHPIASDASTRWITAYRVLMDVAELGEKHQVTFHLENLNTKVDHPGYPLPLVEDVVSLLEAVGSSRLRLNLDLYHAQVEEGNLIDLIHRFSEWIGHVQIADVPGRHEPGTGEIRFEAVADALNAIGYEGVIDFEGSPALREEESMTSFRQAFSRL